MPLVTLDIQGGEGHRTILFEAASEEGGMKLEQEIDELIQKGHTILVTFPEIRDPIYVAGYDSTNNAWITRQPGQQMLPVVTSTATAIKPIVGG